MQVVACVQLMASEGSLSAVIGKWMDPAEDINCITNGPRGGTHNCTLVACAALCKEREKRPGCS